MKKLLPLLLGATAVFTGSAIAQNATTTPVGAMTYSFPATTTAGKSSYLSFPLQADPTYAGKPSVVGTDTLTFAGVAWTTNQFVSNPPSYVVRVLTGQQAGRTLQVTGNSADTLTVSVTDRSSQSTALNGSGFAITTSDSAELVPSDTLSSIFGDASVGNPLVFVGNTSVFTADTVGIFNRTSGKWETYYFSTTGGQGYWRTQAINTNRNSLPIYPDDAITVTRRTNRPDATITLTGRVPAVAPILKANPNASYATSLMVPVDTTLANLNLTGAFSTGTSVFTADTVSLLDATSGKFLSYYKRSDNTWRRESGTTDVSSTPITAGSVIYIRERATNLAGSNSFNLVPLPYTL